MTSTRPTRIRTAAIKTAAVFIIGLFFASPGSANSNVAIALNDLGSGTYLDFEGGLFPGGSNEIPENHGLTGINRGGLVTPRNTAGIPDSNGKIVLLSIGMSNTEQEFCGFHVADGVSCEDWAFVGQFEEDSDVNHDTLVLINGAQAGQTASKWISPANAAYDKIKQDYLAENGYSEAQVQVIWLKLANPNPRVSLPAVNSDAYLLATQLGSIARALDVRYPNLQQVFISSRIYAGYASTPLNPEPFAYENGFSVKWLIEAQIDQMNGGGIDPLTGNLDYNNVAPWISWGPYLWADGLNPRSDGLVWDLVDFQSDGTHPSTAGETKVAALLMDFFKNSSQTQMWFLDDPSPVCTSNCLRSESIIFTYQIGTGSYRTDYPPSV